MKKRSMAYLGITTLVVLIAATFAVESRRTSNAAPEARGALFEGLAGRVNDVAKVEILGGEDETTIERGEDGWVVTSRSGYPAKFESVKQVIVALSQLQIAEGKTRNPEFYERLGVQDPGPDSESMRVVLETEGGDVLADVIVGEKTGSGAQAGVYVRESGAEQAFLCRGNLPYLDAAPKSWLQKDIVKVDTKSIDNVRVLHPDGEELRIQRMAPDSSQFEVLDKPAGREEKYTGVANSVASNLASLTLDDVRPAGEVDFDAGRVSTVEYHESDGQVIVVEAAEADGKSWIRLSSYYEAPPEPPAEEVAEGPEAPETEDAPPILPDEGETKAEPDPDAVRAEVDSFNERLAGWAFAVPSYKFDNLKKRMEDLLKEVEEGPTMPEDLELQDLAPAVDADGQEVEAPTEDTPAEDDGPAEAPPAPPAKDDGAL